MRAWGVTGRALSFAVLAALGLLVWGGDGAALAQAGAKKWLVTPEEALMMRARGAPPAEPPAANTGGPAIVVLEVERLGNLRAPVSLTVRFEPGGSGDKPDMKTLNVTLRGFFTIDITDRLREYVQGEAIEIKEANLPTGDHHIRVAIADMRGRQSRRDVVLGVRE